MSNTGLLLSAFRGKNDEGEPTEKLGDLSGLGSIIGIVAAFLGLLIGTPLLPTTAIPWKITNTVNFVWVFGSSYYQYIYIAAFMGLLGLGLFLQALGSREMRGKLGSMIGNAFILAFILALAVAVFAIIGFNDITYFADIPGYLATLYLLAVFFVLTWQVTSVFYIDSSVSWIGFLAGLLNGLFIPLLALGQAIGPIFTYTAYIVLLLGQFTALVYWWSPYSTIREFARSPAKAKFAFGVSGFLTFLIGAGAAFLGPITVDPLNDGQDILIWKPWSTVLPGVGGDPATTYLTNPALIYALLAMMLVWIMLAPRLGAKELKAAAIGDDIIKGGSKGFAMFLLFIGLLATAEAGSFVEGVGSWGYLIVIGVAGAMVLIGSMYTAKTDIVTGLPLIIAGVFTMIHPYTIAILVVIPWIAVILTQFFIMIESRIRGLTGFSQGVLTVVVSIFSSAMIIVFMIGGLGTGPLALWPTNRWFNISLFPNVPLVLQDSVIIILPFLVLMLRNASLAGFSHGRGYVTGGILMGATVLFSFMIPAIAGNFTVTHEANTGAALLLALYSISLVLLIGLNMNLANDVIEKGHDFEGTFIKIASIGQLIFGAIVALVVLFYFSGLPNPDEIALVVSLLAAFVISSEILSIAGWFMAGWRLGMLKEGFRFSGVSSMNEAAN